MGAKEKKKKRCEREAAAGGRAGGGGGGGDVTNMPAIISQFKVLMILKMLI